MDNELKLLIGKDEKIIYAGKPNKKCFIFESIFNPLLPFALIWGSLTLDLLALRSRPKMNTLAFSWSRSCCSI